MDDNKIGKYSPVAGVILAAGATSRMGQPKLLLPWKGEALICRDTRTALDAGLDTVVVVTGSGIVEMQAPLQPIGIPPDCQKQSTLCILFFNVSSRLGTPPRVLHGKPKWISSSTLTKN